MERTTRCREAKQAGAWTRENETTMDNRRWRIKRSMETYHVRGMPNNFGRSHHARSKQERECI